jgi:5-methylthioadenosine/S-adenosylhomocysteine deaminase
MCATSPRSSIPEASSVPPVTVDLVLANGWVVTCDPRHTTIRNGALAVDNGTIAAVGTTEEIGRYYSGRHVVDLSDHLLLPGLINAHTHAAMTCFRGLADDLPLQEWLHQVIFPAEGMHVNPELVTHGTLLAAAEMLTNGVTTVCDGYFFEEHAAQAFLESGMRAVLAQGILDLPTPDQPDPTRMRDHAREFLDRFPSSEGRLRPSLFCHAPYTCSPDTMQWVKDPCCQHGMIFQTHLSETVAEVREVQQRYGERPVLFLRRPGSLDQTTLCAHGVWLDAEEIQCLAEHGVALVHTPESNMKLASGIAPLPTILAAGIRVGLGTDGCASNNDLDLFAEMGMAARCQKAFSGDPVVASAREVLHMATLNGARALGWDSEIGSLEVGKQADIVAIDLKKPHLTPLYDPISHLVYVASGSDVTHVWVAGQEVVIGGELMTADVKAVMAEVRRLAAVIGAGQTR